MYHFTHTDTQPPSVCWGTGISELTRGLAILPQGGSRSLRWSEIRMENPQEDPLAVHCFCVCSGSVLLGDLLGVSRSREHDILSVLFIYPRFICVCSLCLVAFFVFILFCYNLMHVCCFGLVVNTCAPRHPSVWLHLFCGAGHKKRRGEQLKWSLACRMYIGSFIFHVLPGPVHIAWLGRVCFI